MLSNITTGNTVFFTKKCVKYLQVKKLRIMFVSESNNPLENDEIRPLKQTTQSTELIAPVCFNLYISVFIAI